MLKSIRLQPWILEIRAQSQIYKPDLIGSGKSIALEQGLHKSSRGRELQSQLQRNIKRATSISQVVLVL